MVERSHYSYPDTVVIILVGSHCSHPFPAVMFLPHTVVIAIVRGVTIRIRTGSHYSLEEPFFLPGPAITILLLPRRVVERSHYSNPNTVVIIPAGEALF